MAIDPDIEQHSLAAGRAGRPTPRHRPRPGPLRPTDVPVLAADVASPEPQPQIESLSETAVTSAMWVAFQKWGVTLAGLITFTVLGRLLSPAQIGLGALAMVFVTLFQVLADQGFSKSLIQKHELERRDLDAAFQTTMIAATVLVAATVALSPVASRVFHQPELGPILCALAPMLLISAAAGVPEAMLEREFKFRSLTIRTLIGAVVGGVVGITCAVLGAGVWSIVIQALVQSAVQMVVVWRAIEWRPSFRLRIREARELRSTGLSILGIEMVALANAQGDKLLVGAFLGPRDLGYYYIGTRIVTIITDVQTSVIEGISLTTLSRLQRDRERLRDAFYKLTSVGAATGIVLFALAAVTARVILPAVFGPAWTPAAPIMQLLCVMGCLNAIIIFDRNALIATGAARSALIITVVQCVVGLIAVGIAVPFGVLAVALAVVFRQYAVWPLRLKNVRDAVGISLRRYVLNWLGPMLSGGIVFALGSLANWKLEPAAHLGPRLIYLVAVATAGLAVYMWTLRWTSRTAYADLMYVGRTLLARVGLGRYFPKPQHAL